LPGWGSRSSCCWNVEGTCRPSWSWCCSGSFCSCSCCILMCTAGLWFIGCGYGVLGSSCPWFWLVSLSLSTDWGGNVSWSGLVQSLAFFLPLEGGLLFHPDDCVCVPAMGVLVCILMLALLLWRLIFNNAVMVFWKSGARLVPLFWVQTLALCPLPLRVWFQSAFSGSLCLSF
jgi:hypothetical protein